MSISCIAIDDDPHSLESLISYMEKLPELDLIQTFTEPLQALAEISMSKPVDIIFMDVEMPALSGIELAGLLRQKAKHLIFTTAHPRYALDAFKVDADAYLLKPYTILNFAKTINNLYPAGNQEHISYPIFDDHFFYVPFQNDNGDLLRIELIDLIAMEQKDQEIAFITSKLNFVSSKIDFVKMINMLQKHPAFIQISNDVIISKQHIKGVLGNQILLSKETSFAIADTHQINFNKFIQSNQPQPN
ncbi:LytR/AlgR family response regulator transcription factor [Pedobacter sandarakinus]|uniref:LytR/AlgR family response regulator transcription factor n=1 Tax=Pedobacter sandarakinus TaxID=353156 RepID=UPI0022451668|nr:response regulator [Pedobacter sandarakinus]MCX2574395.1 response regulator [Pedobacter sandarakinus]